MWPELIPGRGSGVTPVKRPAAGVQNLRVFRDHLLNLGEVFDGIVVKFGMEAGRRAVNLSGVRGEAGLDPGAEAAVENVDVVCSEGAEHPSGPRGGEVAYLFVEDDAHMIPNTEGRHAAREVLGCGHHVGQRGRVIGEFIDIEEDRAGNVFCDIQRMGVLRWGDANRRKRGVKDYGAGIVKTAGQPGGGDERIHGN